MSKLSQEDIQHLGRLARLEISEEEADRYAGQLTKVVDYVEQLQAVPTEKVKAVRGVTGLENMLAEDVHRAPTDPCNVDSQALIQAAPLYDGSLIEVRAVLSDEGGAA